MCGAMTLNRIIEKINEIPRDNLLIAHCQAGYRSSIACSILENQGYSNFADLIGGISAWESFKN